MLGINYRSQSNGLYVNYTHEGFPAYGQLRKGDTLLRITDGERVYRTKSMSTFEQAKAEIGVAPAALEVQRRGKNVYFEVTFEPVGGDGSNGDGSNGDDRPKSATRRRTRIQLKQSDDARDLFDKVDGVDLESSGKAKSLFEQAER